MIPLLVFPHGHEPYVEELVILSSASVELPHAAHFVISPSINEEFPEVIQEVHVNPLHNPVIIFEQSLIFF